VRFDLATDESASEFVTAAALCDRDADVSRLLDCDRWPRTTSNTSGTVGLARSSGDAMSARRGEIQGVSACAWC
jgi:hypothetical protein